MSQVMNEGRHAGEFLVSEEDGDMSRSVITLPQVNDIVLPAGTVLGKLDANDDYYALDVNANTGIENAAAVLLDEADISAGPATAVAFVRLCQVNGGEITWPDGITAPEKAAAIADLAARNIIVR